MFHQSRYRRRNGIVGLALGQVGYGIGLSVGAAAAESVNPTAPVKGNILSSLGSAASMGGFYGTVGMTGLTTKRLKKIRRGY